MRIQRRNSKKDAVHRNTSFVVTDARANKTWLIERTKEWDKTEDSVGILLRVLYTAKSWKVPYNYSGFSFAFIKLTFLQAVCCGDGLHCCPGGYQCVLFLGICLKLNDDTLQRNELVEVIRYYNTHTHALAVPRHCFGYIFLNFSEPPVTDAALFQNAPSARTALNARITIPVAGWLEATMAAANTTW